MLEDGIIIEAGTGKAKYGRKPILLEINSDRYYAVGLNISRSGYSAGIVDIKGSLKHSYNFDNSNYMMCNSSDMTDNTKVNVERELNYIKHAINDLIKIPELRKKKFGAG